MSNVPSKELRRRAKELRALAAQEEKALAEQQNSEQSPEPLEWMLSGIIVVFLLVVFAG